MGGVAAETGQPTGTDVEGGAPPRRDTWRKRSRSPMRARLGSGARRAPSHAPRVGPSCSSSCGSGRGELLLEQQAGSGARRAPGQRHARSAVPVVVDAARGADLLDLEPDGRASWA